MSIGLHNIDVTIKAATRLDVKLKRENKEVMYPIRLGIENVASFFDEICTIPSNLTRIPINYTLLSHLGCFQSSTTLCEVV